MELQKQTLNKRDPQSSLKTLTSQILLILLLTYYSLYYYHHTPTPRSAMSSAQEMCHNVPVKLARQGVVSSVVTYTALVGVCEKGEQFEQAQKVFCAMQR